MSEVNLNFGVTGDAVNDFMKALQDMQAKRVLAGFPEDTSERQDADGNEEPISNAALAYIHNTGMPELNIPQREFMASGIESKKEEIADGMRSMGIAALDGDSQQVDIGLNEVGITAKSGIQNKIVEGPFEPLAESTLKARARRGRTGAQGELDRREAGEDAGTDLARPLNDTGQMRNAVNYVIRKE